MNESTRKKDIENSRNPSKATDLFDLLRQNQTAKTVLQEDSSSDDGFFSGNIAIDSDEQQPSIHQQDAAVSDNSEPTTDSASVNSKALSPDARRALVNVLRFGVILASQKPKLFDLICRYQSAVKNYLSDIYLKLILDERTGVAFIARQDENDNEDDEESVSLITRRTLSLYDTLLLLVLRKHYQERESSGEQRIIIDSERIEAHLTRFLALTNSSKSDRKKLNSALRKMVEKHILSSVRGSDDRFEITPIIRYVVNAEFLEKMLEEYQRLSQKAELTTESESDEKEIAVTKSIDNG